MKKGYIKGNAPIKAIIEIEQKTKTIKIILKNNQSFGFTNTEMDDVVSSFEVYNVFKDLFDTTEMIEHEFPIKRITDNIFKIQHGWSIVIK